jgi:hypothetical protein
MASQSALVENMLIRGGVGAGSSSANPAAGARHNKPKNTKRDMFMPTPLFKFILSVPR